MIVLDSNTKSLQVKLGGAVTTNQLPFSASYEENSINPLSPPAGSPYYIAQAKPQANDGTTNGTTAVDLVSAPDLPDRRTVLSFFVQNKDTVAATVTVQVDNNGTARELCVFTLQVNETLQYAHGEGFRVLDAQGRMKTSISAFAENIDDAIVNGVTDRAPSQNAVYDALQLKLDDSMATDRILGRDTAGTGAVEQLTASQVKTILSLDNVPNVSKLEGITFCHSSLSPLDSVTYYIGTSSAMSAATSSIASRRYRTAGSGTISRVFMAISCSAGGNQAVTFELHNITAGTMRTISSAIDMSIAHQNAEHVLASPLSYSDGDELEVHLVGPAWSPNPSQVACSIIPRFNQTT